MRKIIDEIPEGEGRGEESRVAAMSITQPSHAGVDFEKIIISCKVYYIVIK